MKTTMIAALLSFGAASGATITSASADPLRALESACRTGVYSACTQYNATVIARSAVQDPAMIYGFDPFAIVPATHSERTPKPPAPAPVDLNAGNAGFTAAVTKISQ